jgi:hypothetical protein
MRCLQAGIRSTLASLRVACDAGFAEGESPWRGDRASRSADEEAAARGAAAEGRVSCTCARMERAAIRRARREVQGSDFTSLKMPLARTMLSPLRMM